MVDLHGNKLLTLDKGKLYALLLRNKCRGILLKGHGILSREWGDKVLFVEGNGEN